MNKVIIGKKVTKTFKDGDLVVPVLRDVDIAISAGELVAIIGQSGAGKSTLLQLLGGLDAPSSGNIVVDGQSLTELNERQKGRLRNRSLGFIYQFHHLLPEFNALENVCMPLLIRGEKPSQALDKARDIIVKVGLAERMQHRVGELSGGERQRIAIARALVSNPKCVLADEPTGNLDEDTADKVLHLILQLNQDLKISFVIVTHNRALAARMQRTLMLENHALNEL